MLKRHLAKFNIFLEDFLSKVELMYTFSPGPIDLSEFKSQHHGCRNTLETFRVKRYERQQHPPSTWLFNVVLEIWANVITQGNRIKSMKIRKEEVKLSLPLGNMINAWKTLKNQVKYIIYMKRFSKVAEPKINAQKYICKLWDHSLGTIVTKKVKHLRVDLIRNVQEL